MCFNENNKEFKKLKYYTIYQTTNLINDKIYIGRHTTKRPNDSYLGSGKLLIEDIKKFGSKNFKKDILFIFDNPEEMILKEKEIVNEEFVNREDTYNIALAVTTRGFLGHTHSEESKQKIREKRALQVFSEDTIKKLCEFQSTRTRQPHKQEAKDKISKAHKGKKCPPRTKDHCEKLSNALKGRKITREQQLKLAEGRKDSIKCKEVLKKMADINRGKKRPPEVIETIRKSKVLKKLNAILSNLIYHLGTLKCQN